MNAVVVCRNRQSVLAATFVLSLAGSTALAQDESASATTAMGMGPNVVPEVSATTVPRFDPDAASRSTRIDVTWLPPRRSALGLSLGMTSTDGLGLGVPAALAGSGQSLDVGLHWRYTMDTNYRIDVTAWRRAVPADAASLIHLREPGYGARVEMRIGRAPTGTGFVAERGFIGLQLESGARITLRRSGGKPMVYYRAKF
jgi:hypothetical protein